MKESLVSDVVHYLSYNKIFAKSDNKSSLSYNPAVYSNFAKYYTKSFILSMLNCFFACVLSIYR